MNAFIVRPAPFAFVDLSGCASCRFLGTAALARLEAVACSGRPGRRLRVLARRHPRGVKRHPGLRRPGLEQELISGGPRFRGGDVSDDARLRALPRGLWRGAAPSDKGEVWRVDGAVAMLGPDEEIRGAVRLLLETRRTGSTAAVGRHLRKQQIARPQRILTAPRAATLVPGEQGGDRVPGMSSVAVKRYKVSGGLHGVGVSVVSGIRIAVVPLQRADLQARRRDIGDGGLQFRHRGAPSRGGGWCRCLQGRSDPVVHGRGAEEQQGRERRVVQLRRQRQPSPC